MHKYVYSKKDIYYYSIVLEIFFGNLHSWKHFSFIHSFVHSFIHSFIHLSVRSFIDNSLPVFCLSVCLSCMSFAITCTWLRVCVCVCVCVFNFLLHCLYVIYIYKYLFNSEKWNLNPKQTLKNSFKMKSLILAFLHKFVPVRNMECNLRD